RLANVVGDGDAINVDFDAAAQVARVDPVIRVGQPIRVDDFHAGGIARGPEADALGKPVIYAKPLAIDQLVAKGEAELAAGRELLRLVVPAADILRIGAP